MTPKSKNTFISNALCIFPKIGHMVGHRKSLNKLKKIKIISSIFLYHDGLNQETNLKEKTKKHSNSWRLNSMLLNNEWVKNGFKAEIKKFLETNENGFTTTQNV